jgi:hypothetical protein
MLASLCVDPFYRKITRNFAFSHSLDPEEMFRAAKSGQRRLEQLFDRQYY